MKKLIYCSIFVLVLIVQTSYSQGFPYHLYAPRTFAELNTIDVGEKVRVTNTVSLVVSTEPYYSAVRLEFTGKSRNLSVKKLGYYKFWVATLNVGDSKRNTDVLRVIEKEFLFRECGKEYWITVQTTAAKDFPEELKNGDKITLYLMKAGGIETKGEMESMYLTNSFRVYQ